MLFWQVTHLIPVLLLTHWILGGTPAQTWSSAQDNPPQAMGFTLEGKISRVARNKLTLSTEQNMIFHVSYDDKTEIKRKDGSPASAKDLRVGTTVRVDGDLTESGEIVARLIQFQEDQPSKK